MATITRSRTTKVETGISKLDFTKVGGLESHLKLLREIIILPLIHGKVYTHFNIKAPRGVLFYGPPGTGKTLVAGALANEVNQESCGKVSFFHRKGADILDKWVGESEKKLRDLFDKAVRSRPSILFFDEIDGLAPERTNRNEQVHASIVSTLLALMDGLDNKTGVIIIGATNRIESIDPALRRPGRFDRELYFPLPCLNSRIEILQVHIKNWKNKPQNDFLYKLAERTTGYCGSDLQALCAESVLCCLKRNYPLINIKPKIRIELENMQIEERDFLEAQVNIKPASQRFGRSKRRPLSGFIKPLLLRQVDMAFNQIQLHLPHFIEYQQKFSDGFDRYAGRVLLKGNLQQGVNSHVVPALLQRLEHIPNYVVDVPMKFHEMFHFALRNLPSILVLSRVDEWWEIIDSTAQLSIASNLDEIHAGLPILLIATCSSDLPQILDVYFYDNCSIILKIEDPRIDEREFFFAPLFFGKEIRSLYRIWAKSFKTKEIKQESDMAPPPKVPTLNKFKRGELGKIQKPMQERNKKLTLKDSVNCCSFLPKNLNRVLLSPSGVPKDVPLAVRDLVNCKVKPQPNVNPKTIESKKCTSFVNNDIKSEWKNKVSSQSLVDKDLCPPEIVDLWKRVAYKTGDGLSVVHLELLYDTLQGCINIHDDEFSKLMENLCEALNKFEKSVEKKLGSKIVP